MDRPAPAARFAFPHLLTREAAHNALLASNRRALHSAAADALARQVVAGAPDEVALLRRLIGHLAAAQRWPEAHRHCCELLRQRIGEDIAAEWLAWAAQAQTYWTLARQGDRALPEQSARLVQVWTLYYGLGGQLTQAQAQAELGLALARQQADPQVYAGALLSSGMVQHYAGQQDAAIDWYGQALAAYRACGDAPGAARALNSLGVALQETGRLRESYAAHLEAMDLARTSGNLLLQANLALNLGAGAQEQVELETAGDWYARALELARRVGSRTIEGLVLGNQGDLAAHAGDHPRALELYGAAQQQAREAGSPRFTAWWTGKLAAQHLRLGDAARAAELIEAALVVVRRAGDRTMELEGLLLAAHIEYARDRRPAAGARLDAAAAILDTAGAGVRAYFTPQLAACRAVLAAPGRAAWPTDGPQG
jgi:tetratricopeptide (TPR) repeat protein